MILFIVYLAAIVYAILSYMKGYYYRSLIVFVFFLTSGFQLIPESLLANSPVNKYFDFCLIYIVVLNIHLFSKNKRTPFSSGLLTKYLLLLLAYVTIELLVTVYLGKNAFADALKVYRYYLFTLIYFILIRIDKNTYLHLFHFLFRMSVALSLLFILQVLFKTPILTGSIDGLTMDRQGVDVLRYRNIPIYLDYAILYIFISDKPKYKWLIAPILLATFFIPMNRGPIIAIVLALVIYYLLSGKVTKLAKLASFAFIIGILAWPFIETRFSSIGEETDIFKIIKSENYGVSNTVEGSATFSFRIALLMERIYYVTQDPLTTFFGEGIMHEDAPQTQQKFRFVFGAMKFDANGEATMQQVDTTDLAWATMLLRLGFVGVFIYLVFYLHLLKYFFKEREDEYARIAFLLVLMYLINSFATDVLIRPAMTFLFFAVYHYLKIIEEEKRYNWVGEHELN